ncbi:double-strand break repair helicase AddA [Rhodobacteraceae bacterium 63075]|nr:double-strand break repair helicase AddA [Rhodobacteraceae bacterium 63075]
MSAALSQATLKQIDAAEPQRSTWLSANAGSGKTRVLTNRVARLLLEGTDPQNILCLTYTKAAASEMQNRLFSRLGSWAMMEKSALSQELHGLGVSQGADPAFLAQARRLFAQAIETPGGLRIQTIHSFCASLLRRFPREAMVTPGFTELDDRSAAQLRERVADDMSGGEDHALLFDMIKVLGGNDFEKFTADIVSKKAIFDIPLSYDEAKVQLGLKPDDTVESLLSEVFSGGEKELLAELTELLLSGEDNTSDQAVAHKLTSVNRLDQSALPILESAFLFGGNAKSPFGAKAGKFPTKKSLDQLPELQALVPQLDALMLRVEAARPKRIALASARESATLNAFARAFLARYNAAKEARGWLDFDDLINKTRALLTDPQVAEWVLYRLDGGMDHILVDEAQDTSPEQWAVIEQLAQEITSGEGARENRQRTIFAVGDKKQSIYSFQGADATEFERMRETFDRKLAHHETQLHRASLDFSFRSSPAILELVDEVFAAHAGSGFSQEKHIAYHADMPGRVDIWEPVAEADKAQDREWYDPVDIVSPGDPVVQLAERIALQIKAMIDAETLIPIKNKDGTWQARPVHEGNFLILLQRRRELFHEIIRACKKEGLEIAGADRLRINEELAVKDLTALLNFLETPEDDLSLAAVLRSPLFGWSEQDLYSLSAHRGSAYLWTALRNARDQYPETLAILDDLRSQTDFLRPYELIDRMLTRHRGRKNILARLGHEAEEAVDAFLDLALAYERSAVPSLTGFLSWLASDDPEVKRQAESAGKRIRVMTVHGAKGLEAPIVIMPETMNREPPPMGQVLPHESGAFYVAAKEARPPAIAKVHEAAVTKLLEERLRLLYVSMTRAEKWLIIAAAGKTDPEKSWYHDISEAADRIGCETVQEHGQSFRRIERGDWSALAPRKDEAAAAFDVALEPLFHAASATPARPGKARSASELPGEKALGSDRAQDRKDAKAYGTMVHLLLEHLPAHDADNWPDIAKNLLAPFGDDATIAKALAEARAVLTASELQHLFTPDTLSEVALTVPSETLGTRLHGTIDKLLIGGEKITVIDFKTNPTIPGAPSDCPVGILRQMGAYIEALQKIYPSREIEAQVLWTHAPKLMSLPHDLVMNAYERTPYLDDAETGS